MFKQAKIILGLTMLASIALGAMAFFSHAWAESGATGAIGVVQAVSTWAFA